MHNMLLMMLLIFIPLTDSDKVEKADTPPESLYDFWVGEWDLTWINKDGEEYHGSNTIRKIMDGKVIEENFRALDGKLKGFEGKSWSVYSPSDGKWKQTWVDNQGGYLDFDGKQEGDKRIFYRISTDPEGNELHARMVFHNISEDSFDWDWQMSRNGGESWDTIWSIAYQRRK